MTRRGFSKGYIQQARTYCNTIQQESWFFTFHSHFNCKKCYSKRWKWDLKCKDAEKKQCKPFLLRRLWMLTMVGTWFNGGFNSLALCENEFTSVCFPKFFKRNENLNRKLITLEGLRSKFSRNVKMLSSISSQCPSWFNNPLFVSTRKIKIIP